MNSKRKGWEIHFFASGAENLPPAWAPLSLTKNKRKRKIESKQEILACDLFYWTGLSVRSV